MAARWLAGGLSVLMVCCRWRRRRARLPSPRLGSRAARGQVEQGAKATTKESTTKRSTAKRPVARSRKPVSRGTRASRAARAARTARMQEGLCGFDRAAADGAATGTMRTPAAYAGVTAYAHKHTGEAAAAAYLALGHAYLLDKRYAEAEASFQQARKAGEIWRTMRIFWARRPTMKRATMRRPRRCCTGSLIAIRTASSTIGAGAGGQCAAGDEQCRRSAQRVLARARGWRQKTARISTCAGAGAFALGQKDAAGRIFKRLLLAHPLSRRRRWRAPG